MRRQQLGAFVRAVRLRKGLSGHQLAADIGHSLTWLYRLETGDRTAPESTSLEAIARVCELTPWETYYLSLLAGRPLVSHSPFDETSVHSYLSSRGEVAAWLGHKHEPYYTPEFLRLFKRVDHFPDIGEWHWLDPLARRVILNWDQVANWLVSAWRLRVAHDDSDSANVQLTHMLDIADFRRRWESTTIPDDPSAQLWIVRDDDNADTRVIEMRVWTHLYQMGILLVGFSRV